MMMKKFPLFMFLLLGFQYTGNAQISAPATAIVGTPVAFSGPPGKATYTWSYEPTKVDMNTSIPSTEIALVNQPQHVSVLNDKGHWYAFVMAQSTRSLMRIDLGADPTVPSTAIADLGNFTFIAKTEIGTTFIYDSTSGNWHAFIGQIGDATTTSYLMIRRLDFGNSLANTPVAVKVNTPSTAGAQVCDMTVVKEKNEYMLFVTHRGGPAVRLDLGTDVTNVNPADVVLTALTRSTSIALYQQDTLWYGLAVSTDNGALRRIDFGPAGLKNNAPVVTTVGSNVIGASNNWAARIVPGNCGQDLVAYVNSANVIKRLNFNGSITNTPAAATNVNATAFLGNNKQGFYPYVFRDTLYAMTTSYSNGKVYNMKLSELPAGTEQKYADPGLVHTFSAPGVYNVSLVTNMNGNASRVSCHSITVMAAPAQPGAYTVSKPVVCRKESNVTYTVPAVTGATSYEWLYTGGTGVTFSAGATTTTPTNNLSFSASATDGTLQVRAVNAGGSSAYRDMAVKVNTLPAVTTTNTGTRSICSGDSLHLSATASGVSYQWKNGTTNVGTNSASYYAKTAGSYTVVVTSTSTNCPDTSASATILSINPLPTVTATNTGAQAICPGDSLLLSATASGVSYQWKNGTTNVGTNSPSYYAKAAGSYAVTVTSTTTTCSATSSPATILTIKPLPSVTVNNTGARAICAGDSLLLSATASGVSYQWKNGTTNVGTNSAGYYAKAAGSYTVTVTSTTTNCSATSAPVTTLSVNPLPAATLSTTPPSVVCVGDSVILTAGTGNNYTYQWKEGSTYTGTGGNIYIARTTGDYSVVTTDGSTGCKDSTAAVPVTVHPRPVVSLTPGDTSFCEGGIVTLSVSTQDTGLNYRWKNGTATVPQATAYFLEIGETGVYTVVAGRSQVANCADSTNEVTVTVYPLPVADITWDGLLLHAIPGYAGYQWNTGGQGMAGATDSTFQPSADGGYSVTVTDSNGCSRTSAVFNVRVSVDNIAALAAQIKIYPNPSNGVVYIAAPREVRVTLSSMEGKLLLQEDNAELIDMRSYADGVYLLRITDENGVLIRNEKLVKRNW